MLTENIDSSYHTLMRQKFAGVLWVSAKKNLKFEITMDTHTPGSPKQLCTEFLRRSCIIYPWILSTMQKGFSSF